MNTPMMNDGPDSGAELPSGRNRPPVTLIALVVVAVLAVVFVFRNSDRTTIDFVFFDVDSRVWVAIAISIALGILLDRLILGWWRRSRRRKSDA